MCLSRYWIACITCCRSSKWPHSTLHRWQSKPRTASQWWQWSTSGLVNSTLQTAHFPDWFSHNLANDSLVKLYKCFNLIQRRIAGRWRFRSCCPASWHSLHWRCPRWNSSPRSCLHFLQTMINPQKSESRHPCSDISCWREKRSAMAVQNRL